MTREECAFEPAMIAVMATRQAVVRTLHLFVGGAEDSESRESTAREVSYLGTIMSEGFASIGTNA